MQIYEKEKGWWRVRFLTLNHEEHSDLPVWMLLTSSCETQYATGKLPPHSQPIWGELRVLIDL